MGVRFQKSYIYKIPQFISALVASLSLYKWLHLGLLLKITCSIESLTNHISLGRENEETGEEAFLGPLQSLLGAGGSVWSSKRGVVASNHQKGLQSPGPRPPVQFIRRSCQSNESPHLQTLKCSISVPN